MNDAAQHSDAFEAALARLKVRVEQACFDMRTPDWALRAAAAIRAALDFASADPAAAQTLTNDALAEGSVGFARYDQLLEHFSEMLLPGREVRPQGEYLPEITEKMMVGGLAMLVAQRLDHGRHVELPSLAPEAIQFMLTPYVGAEEARRVAGDSA